MKKLYNINGKAVSEEEFEGAEKSREEALLPSPAKVSMLNRLADWKYNDVVVDLTNATLWRNSSAKIGAINARAATGVQYRPITLITGFSEPMTFKSADDFIKFYIAAEVENEEAVAEMYAASAG